MFRYWETRLFRSGPSSSFSSKPPSLSFLLPLLNYKSIGYEVPLFINSYAFSPFYSNQITGEPWIHYLSTSYRSRALTRYIIDIPFGFHPDAWMVLSLFPSFFFLPLLPYIPSPLNQHPKFACITCFLSLSCLLSLEAND